MNAVANIQPYQGAIKESRERFQQIAEGGVRYDIESVFAMQALLKNDYATQVANANPRSVHLAMINVASTGLTLNPANGYAYLVPRDKQIVLDISYKGLIKIATDTGSIVWARADVVHEADEFTYHGPACIPEHKSNPFKGRGEIIGAYCIAKTSEGDVLTEVMDRAELEKIRGKSDLYSRKKSGPWAEWYEQMAKKAVIKRASKTWPYTDKSERIAQAVEIANNSEGGYSLESDEEKAHKRQQVHDAALGRHYQSVDAIKAELSKDDPDMHSVSEMWNEIPQDDQIALWLAPSKGGVFSTAERKAIKNGCPAIESAA